MQRNGLLMFLLSCLFGCLSAVEVVMNVPSQVLPNVAFDMRLEIQNPKGSPRNLELPESGVVTLRQHARHIQRQTQIINGHATTTYFVYLQGVVAELGEQTIPPVTVIFSDGSKAVSKPTTVSCKEGDSRLNDHWFAEVIFEPATIVPGQVTTMSLHLYSRRSYDARSNGPGVSPPAEATSIIEQPAQLKIAYGAQGDVYRHRIFSWEMSFIKPGTYTVSGQQSFYRENFLRFQKIGTTAIKQGGVTVVAFPQQGRPADFSGAVGPLKVHTDLERQTVSLGEGTTFTVRIQGQQLANLPRPHLQPKSGYRLHELEAEDVIDGRAFTWNVEPVQTGDLVMPTVSISYFDPIAKQYARTDSGTARLTVLPGRKQQLNIAGGLLGTTAAGSEASAAATVIMPPPLRQAGSPAWRAWFLPLSGLCALILGFGLVQGRRGRQQVQVVAAGKELRQAIRQEDLEAINRILQRESMHLHGEDAELCRRVIRGVEDARFGGGTLQDSVRTDLEQLGRIL